MEGVNILQCVCGTSEYSAVCVGGVNILQCVCGRSEYICGKGVNTRFPQGPLYLGIPLHSMEIKKFPQVWTKKCGHIQIRFSLTFLTNNNTKGIQKPSVYSWKSKLLRRKKPNKSQIVSTVL